MMTATKLTIISKPSILTMMMKSVTKFTMTKKSKLNILK